VQTTPSTTPLEYELADLRVFHRTSSWTTTPADHARKCREFNNKDKRKMDIMDWKKMVGALKRAEDMDVAEIEWTSR
jgi:hypothetical protein